MKQPVERDLPHHADGDLVVMTPEKLRKFRRKRWSEENSAGSVQELAELGKSRGYRYPRKWAEYRFAELHP